MADFTLTSSPFNAFVFPCLLRSNLHVIFQFVVISQLNVPAMYYIPASIQSLPFLALEHTS